MDNDLLKGYKPHSNELELHYKQQGIWDNQPIWELITRIAQSYPHRCAVRDLSSQLLPGHVWTTVTKWEDADLSSLRLLQVGGPKLSPTDAQAAMNAFPGALQQVFGMAEGLICYTQHEDTVEVITETQGRPMSSLDELRVVDDYG
ncbi:AMP-binding protein [Microbulbifer epialgicus]|uniref:AMP-binding protein n=1 Tax=Microbulbifer epialgicus TaxID=393907 RepID=A0ABV4P3X1_9GAMM